MEDLIEVDLEFESSNDIPFPGSLIDQIIGQDEAVQIIKKAAIQQRNVLLIGDPGTGKSMLAQALAELLPTDKLQDIWCLPNPNNPNQLRIVTISSTERLNKALLEDPSAHILVNNSIAIQAPFVDATSAPVKALLGSVEPEGTNIPIHKRITPGLIHKSHGGVLFIHEVHALNQETQLQLLTAMQEKQLSITGQSGIVSTEAIPCDFVLVISGNIDTVKRMHPVLRSHISGYGYEIAVNHSMPDNMENRRKLVRFTAQEVIKDGTIPHFSRSAVLAFILEAKKHSIRKNRLSLILGDLGGLIRAAGDLAREEGAPFTEVRHVLSARDLVRSLKNQQTVRQIEYMRIPKEYQVLQTTGGFVGRANGLMVTADQTGGARRGHITPIEAQVVPAQGIGGRIIATGSLRVIARESVQNVAVVIKEYSGIDISKMDVHIQFIGVHGVEGDHFAIAIASVIMSDLKQLPVRQDLAMIGSLSVDGDVLPVVHVSAMIEGAVSAGINEVIIPAANLPDVSLDPSVRANVTIVPVKTIEEVFKLALIGYS